MIVQCGQWAFKQLALERTIFFAYFRAHLKTRDIVIEENSIQFYVSAYKQDWLRPILRRLLTVLIC